MKSNRISGSYERTCYFITKTFDRHDYKDLVSIFQLDLQNFQLHSLGASSYEKVSSTEYRRQMDTAEFYFS